MRRLVFPLLLLTLCLLAAAARMWNVRDVFVEGRIYFLDADCYSRMTRARQVATGERLIVRHHDFENWPAGTTPHTTAPMDWAIVALTRMADAGLRLADPGGRSVLRGQTLDLAGALVSPIFGVLACAFLAVWSRRREFSAWIAPPLLFAVSPILVHGTLLGRPDHQSLLILLASVAIAAELALAHRLTRAWGVVAGVAWAAALWVSLYEPLVLLACAALAWAGLDRRRFTAVEMRAGWAAFGIVLVLAWLIDGWRLSWPDASLRSAFAVWQGTVGELGHLDPRAPLLYRWLGFGILVAPVALLVAARREASLRAPALLALVLLLAAFALTVWQLRWGYFLAAIYALSLPLQCAALRRQWLVWPALLLGLWPLAQDWDEKIFAEDHPELALGEQRGVRRIEAVRLREVAALMSGEVAPTRGGVAPTRERRPFLAPWWLSPALAYWSGQPGVAGSSHESLPGIVASARFFLAPDAAEAERIAHSLGVKWIVTDDPERLVATSRALVGGGEKGAPPSFIAHLHEIAEPRERVNADDLRAASPEMRAKLIELADRAEAAQLGTAAFSCVSSNQFYKLFMVKTATTGQPP